MEKAPYFEGYIKESLIKYTRVYVVFYEKSLVICFPAQDELLKTKAHIKEKIKESHVPVLERPAVFRMMLGEYGAKYACLDVKSALGKSARNRQISYMEIEKTVYKRATQDSNGEMNLQVPGQLRLKTENGKLTILHFLEEGSREEQELKRGLSRIEP